MNSKTALAALAATLCAAVLTGCGGSAGARQTAARATPTTPAQLIPSAPDPSSIHVPTAAGPTAIPASPAPTPTGPTAGLTAQQIWDRTAAVMGAQTSLALTVDTSELVGGSSIEVHATSSVAANGDCVGAFTADGGHAQVIHVGRTGQYFKGDRRIWDLLDQGNGGYDLGAQFAGHWTSLSIVQLSTLGLDPMCDLSQATHAVADFGGVKSKRPQVELAGRRAIPVIQGSGPDAVTLYVSPTGPARLIGSIEHDPTTTIITFTGFGEPVRAKAPSGPIRG